MYKFFKNFDERRVDYPEISPKVMGEIFAMVCRYVAYLPPMILNGKTTFHKCKLQEAAYILTIYGPERGFHPTEAVLERLSWLILPIRRQINFFVSWNIPVKYWNNREIVYLMKYTNKETMEDFRKRRLMEDITGNKIKKGEKLYYIE